MRRHVLAIAIATLVFALGVSISLRPRGDKQVATPKQERGKAPISALPISGQAPSAIPRRKAQLVPAAPEERSFDPYEHWELARILEHFLLPPGRLEATDITDATAQIRALYAEHSGGRQLQVAAPPTGATPPGSYAFDYGSISIRQLLGIVAALGGFDLDVSDTQVALVPKRSSTPPGAIVTKEIRVPPDFVALANQAAGERPAVDDPFTPPPSAPEIDLRAVFERYGVVIGEDTKIEVDPQTSTWTLTGPAAEAERFEGLVSATAAGSPAQLFLTHKIVSAANGQTIEPQTFADEASLSEAMRELSETPGIEIVSAPSIVTRPGQRAKIELIREVIYPTEHDATGNPTQFDMTPVGLSIPIVPHVTGLDRVQLQGAAEFTGFGDQPLSELVGGGFGNVDEDRVRNAGADSFHTYAADFEGQLFDGNTAVVLAAQEDGTSVYHFITARRLAPDGSPLLQHENERGTGQ